MLASGVIPEFGTDGYLPCGRYQVDMDTAYRLLVGADRFKSSAKRPGLWRNLTIYLLVFDDLEREYADILGGRSIIHHLWIGGSFVSTKDEPDDIDLTVFTDAEAIDALKNKPGSGWIKDAFQRDKIQARYGLDPHQVNYVAVPRVFRPNDMSLRERDYFRDRGRFDDWWQRTHPPGMMDKQAPTVDSCVPTRGYLEVTL